MQISGGKYRPIVVIVALAIGILFVGCNFTVQSFNHGKLLNPGETLTSIGLGSRDFYSIKWKDSIVNGATVNANDTVYTKGFTQALDYRLGVLRKYPFGQGLEIGFHLERPVQFNPTPKWSNTGIYTGSVVWDFDGRFGFNDLILKSGLYHHNLALGWSVGAWIDNGWYAEYAAGWEYKWITPYANFRVEILPTDLSSNDSITESYTPFKFQKQLCITRTVAGVSFRLPHWFFLQPDIISPEVSFVVPNYSAVSKYGFSWQVGLRWLNGI